jgi:predicted nucleic acid-binding protein
MPEKAIVDTSVLIALEKLHLSQVLCKLYSEIILPHAVVDEFGTPDLPCLSMRPVQSRLTNLLVQELSLGKGESEVIALGVESGIRVIIDDSKARKIAESLGLKVVGTIGILLKAEAMGLISSAYQEAIKLKKIGFYLSDELLDKLSSWKR